MGYFHSAGKTGLTHAAHLELDGDPGGEDVEGAGNTTDDEGGPGVHGGCARGDGDQSSQRAVAHDTHVVHMLACHKSQNSLSGSCANDDSL